MREIRKDVQQHLVRQLLDCLQCIYVNKQSIASNYRFPSSHRYETYSVREWRFSRLRYIQLGCLDGNLFHETIHVSGFSFKNKETRLIRSRTFDFSLKIFSKLRRFYFNIFLSRLFLEKFMFQRFSCVQSIWRSKSTGRKIERRAIDTWSEISSLNCDEIFSYEICVAFESRFLRKLNGFRDQWEIFNILTSSFFLRKLPFWFSSRLIDNAWMSFKVNPSMFICKKEIINYSTGKREMFK